MKWIHETNFLKIFPLSSFTFWKSCLLSSFSSFLSPFYSLSVASPSLPSLFTLFCLSIQALYFDWLYLLYFLWLLFSICLCFMPVLFFIFFLHEFFRFFSTSLYIYLSVSPSGCHPGLTEVFIETGNLSSLSLFFFPTKKNIYFCNLVHTGLWVLTVILVIHIHFIFCYNT